METCHIGIRLPVCNSGREIAFVDFKLKKFPINQVIVDLIESSLDSTCHGKLQN
ncbi:hypothetical protein KIN20_016862 [Parelaphostrongylus tenuis]|uniref:Uncharacterized protein n=1 Tax=Parelaphostrongylus tenuis TaxID=148309 RepID=A0AAD5QTF2_PARTN|nr:hypothetical protein KIN20_016862 [Parelaphostrongylus tenuis]